MKIPWPAVFMRASPAAPLVNELANHQGQQLTARALCHVVRIFERNSPLFSHGLVVRSIPKIRRQLR